MTAFLAWLFSQVSKVYVWFGNAFWTLYENAVNAFNWAVTFARDAYYDAVNYAFGLFQDFQNDIRGLFDWVSNQISRIRNDLFDDISGLYDWVALQLSNLGNLIRPVIDTAFETIRSFINSIPVSIRNFVNGLITNLQTWVSNSFAWVLAIRDRILSIIELLTPERIRTMLDFITAWISAITAFFANPLVFILDVIQPLFVSFLCYVLAWSLGATENDLPGQAPWRK